MSGRRSYREDSVRPCNGSDMTECVFPSIFSFDFDQIVGSSSEDTLDGSISGGQGYVDDQGRGDRRYGSQDYGQDYNQSQNPQSNYQTYSAYSISQLGGSAAGSVPRTVPVTLGRYCDEHDDHHFFRVNGEASERAVPDSRSDPGDEESQTLQNNSGADSSGSQSMTKDKSQSSASGTKKKGTSDRKGSGIKKETSDRKGNGTTKKETSGKKGSGNTKKETSDRKGKKGEKDLKK